MATKTKNDGSSPRRNFLKSGIALGTAFSLNQKKAFADLEKEKSVENSDLSEKTKKLMTVFNLKYPIFQAAPGGEKLAITLANAGAMGALSLTRATPEEAFALVTRMKAATKGSFYGNYILHFEPKSLDKALEAGIPCVQFSWGIPSKAIVTKIKAANAKLGIQVASIENAKAALEFNPDFLICQGVEAGGHIQANEPLLDTLKDVVVEAKDVDRKSVV